VTPLDSIRMPSSVQIVLLITFWFFDNLSGWSGRHIDEYVIAGDAGGQAAAVEYKRRFADHPEDHTSGAPVPRHGEYFNAAFLDGHAQPCTHEVYYTPEYFCQPRPGHGYSKDL